MTKKSKSKQQKLARNEPEIIHDLKGQNSHVELNNPEPECIKDEGIKPEGTSEIVVDELSGIKFDIKTQGRVAIKALQKYKQEKNKKALFPEMEDSLFLMIAYKKPAMKTTAKRRRFIDLPHSDRNTENTSLCLIMPDLDRSKVAMSDPDVEKQANQWKEILQEKHGITPKDVTKFYTMRQLEREILTDADKFKLSNTYDIFMVESSIRKVALWHLGGCFQKMAKMPLPINPKRPNVAAQIKQAYGRVSMDVQPLVNNISLRIGNLNMPIAHLAENLNETIDRVLEYCPGGALNIRACYLQSQGCETSLPIYADFGSANEVQLKSAKKRKFTPIVEELTTIPDKLVSVRADGKIFAMDDVPPRKRVKKESESSEI